MARKKPFSQVTLVPDANNTTIPAGVVSSASLAKMLRRSNTRRATRPSKEVVVEQVIVSQKTPKPRKNNTSLPVSQSSNIRGLGAGNGSIRVNGTCRIAQTTFSARTKTDGETVFRQALSMASFPRLERIASAFQRYRFVKLSFEVQPMCPSLTGGGYIAGFFNDPQETYITFDSIQSTHGAVMGKWWEHKTLKSKPSPSLLWTTTGDDSRLYSPGIFALSAVGTNTDTVNVSVICRWEAVVSIPSLEIERPIRKFQTDYNLLLTDMTNATNLVNPDNILKDYSFFSAGQIYRAGASTSIDYSLGVGDVTKASYNDWRVCVSDGSDYYKNFPKGKVLLQYGLYDRGGVWHDGVQFYLNAQPLQCLLAQGTSFRLLYEAVVV